MLILWVILSPVIIAALVIAVAFVAMVFLGSVGICALLCDMIFKTHFME